MFSDISIASIMSVIKGLLGVANKIAGYMEKKQLMDAGKAKQQKENLQEARDAVSKAIDARRDAHRKFKSDGMPKDYKHYRK